MEVLRELTAQEVPLVKMELDMAPGVEAVVVMAVEVEVGLI